MCQPSLYLIPSISYYIPMCANPLYISFRLFLTISLWVPTLFISHSIYFLLYPFECQLSLYLIPSNSYYIPLCANSLYISFRLILTISLCVPTLFISHSVYFLLYPYVCQPSLYLIPSISYYIPLSANPLYISFHLFLTISLRVPTLFISHSV